MLSLPQCLHHLAGLVDGGGPICETLAVPVFEQLVGPEYVEEAAGEQDALLRRLSAAELIDPATRNCSITWRRNS